MRANLNSNLLDVTNRAKRHWNSLLPTVHAQIIRNFKEQLQLLCSVDKMFISVFVVPDETGNLMHDIETSFD
jgi:hypothetical protein